MKKMIIFNPIMLILCTILISISSVGLLLYSNEMGNFEVFLTHFLTNNIIVYNLLALLFLSSSSIFKILSGYNLRLKYKKSVSYFQMITKCEGSRLLILLTCFVIPLLVFQILHHLSGTSLLILLVLNISLFMLIICNFAKIASILLKNESLGFVLVFLIVVISNLVINPNMDYLYSPLFVMLFPIYEPHLISTLRMMIILTMMNYVMTHILSQMNVIFDGGVRRNDE